jgi:hypothetical protein
VIEVQGDPDQVSGSASILRGDAEQETVRRDVRAGVGVHSGEPGATRTHRDFEKASDSIGGHKRIGQDAHGSGAGGILDGRDAGHVDFNDLSRPLTTERRRVAVVGPASVAVGPVHTIQGVEFARDRVANAETSAVLDCQPGVQQARHLNNDEDEQEHDGKHQGEFDNTLAAKAALLRGGGGWLAGGRVLGQKG